MRNFLFVLATNTSVVYSDCGPTDEEAGRAVLFVLPLVYLLGLGILWLIGWLWKKYQPTKGAGTIIRLLVFVVLVLLALGACMHGARTISWFVVPTDIEAALVFAGSSYLSIMLLMWRAHYRPKSKRVLRWSAEFTLVFHLIPASIMALGWTENWLDPYLEAMAFTGFFGVVPGGIFLVLLLERWVRFLMDKSKEKSNIPM